MWCEHQAFRQLLHPSDMIAQYVQGIGIQHHGARGFTYLLKQGYGRILVLSQTWAYAHSVKHIGGHGLCKAGVVGIKLYNGFGHTYLHNVVITTWDMSRNLSYPSL